MRAHPVGMSAREIATRVLADILGSRKNIDICLDKYLSKVEDRQVKSLVQEICYGVMRWYYQLEFILNSLISKPIKNKDMYLKALLLSGIYQIRYLRTPDYAAINESVEVTKAIGKPWASNLVNAVLRRYQREKDHIDKTILDSDITNFSFPAWFIEKIADRWPDNWRTILSASNQYPPMHLRLNTEICSRQDYIKNLASKGIDAEISNISTSGVLLVESLNVEDIPGFTAGYVSVQDFGAQLAAPLLDCKSGHRVLDACAAPGGKTSHILEIYPEISELVAMDIDQNRINLVNDNLDRTNMKAVVYQADVNDVGSWWDDVYFDRVLLDAPCSASGIVRRHPDIKYLRTNDQLPALVAGQTALIESLWQVLKSGGKLVYCTCSMFKEESDDVIAQFFKQHDNVRLQEIDTTWGVKTSFGRQTLPGNDESDGFFYSLLEKT